MAMLQKASGIVLQRRFLKESDALASLLTEEGRSLDFCVYGIQKSRKRSALLLEPGTLIDIDFYVNKDGPVSLKEGHVRERFGALKGAYAPLTLLSYFLELSSFASRYGSSPTLFLLVKGSLTELCLGTELLNLQLLLFFQVRLLKLLGLLGPLERCSECNSPLAKEAYWNLPEAHFSCQSCASQDSSEEERAIAWLLAQASTKRFKDYQNELEQSKEADTIALLKLWRNLNLCLEAFAAKSFQSSKELERQLTKSAASAVN